MQKAYLMALFELAEKDPNVLLLLADSGTAYDELFKKYLPNQILDFGIAEENMVAAAGGMASCGKIPFVYTASTFLAYRSFEFIRNDVCLQNANVKFVGMGEGMSWSTLGPTHHTTEELALLRVLPNLIVLSPSCPSAVGQCVKFAYQHQGPVYIRIGMGGEPELYDKPVDVLKNQTLKDGSDISIFATGSVINEALKAAEMLSLKGVSAKVIDVCAISPFDRENVIAEVKSKRGIVTVEEHNVVGGLGSIVSEIVAEEGLKVNLLKLGIQHGFAKGYGTLAQVREQNGLDHNSIEREISAWLSNGGAK